MNNKKQPSVKILVACHKPCKLLKDECFTPIQVGRAVSEKHRQQGSISIEEFAWMEKNTIGDNTGDNISEKNLQINELTAIYWAWKNYDKLGNPDYIGLMHYRRHLCFDLENKDEPNNVGLINCKQIDNEYIKKFHLTADEVQNVVKHYDIVVGEKCDLKKLGTNNCYNHYLSANPQVQHIEDYRCVLKIIKELYPEYSDDITTYNFSRYAYFTNIFVMKKNLFENYAQWVFSIILEAEKRLDISHYNSAEVRALGYISEWLFGIWYTHLLRTAKVKITELKRTFIEDTSPNAEQEVTPAFSKNNIAVCMATDENYIPYLGVAIQSIIANSSQHNNYDINILCEKISDVDSKKILSLKRSNVSIRFISLESYYRKFTNILYISNHLSKATYNRFFIPIIFKQYEKLLYLDCDLVVNKDIAELYNNELTDNYLLGAVRDFELIRMTNKDKKFGISYIINCLHLENVLNYFQNGVILLNVKQMQKENIFFKFIDTLNKLQTPLFHDQDVFNVVCENRVLFLNAKWNVEFHIPIWSNDWKETMPASVLYDYIGSRNEPWIVHYAGAKKPWHNASLPLAEYFWKYARQTPFYEIILKNLYGNSAPWTFPPETRENSEENKLLHKLLYRQKKRNYLKYKILSHLTFGATRRKYKQKKHDLKWWLKNNR